jgi:hypothetical protein
MFTKSIAKEGAFVIRQSTEFRSEKRSSLKTRTVHRSSALHTTNVVDG